MNNCTLKQYIDASLKNEFTKMKVLSETDYASLTVYKHNSTENKIVLVSSRVRNDHIYRALKNVNCKYLPKIFDICSCDKALYVLEEFIDGKPLSSIMGEGLIAVPSACKYICNVCDALLQLHSQKIIHRDVKPSNILITPDDNAVLIDFNIARLMSDGKCNDTANLGTVGYAAPEQFGIYQSNTTTDIYPLGVILNEMILGVHPTIEVAKGRIGKIINRCITTQMSKRFQSITELKKELKRYIK